MKYITGNMLEAETEALVNTVNTVGVMGKGIALQFKERFPVNFKIYADACKKGEMKVGKMLVVKENTLNGEKLIINFPTKTEWFKKSQYSYIEVGLKDLVRVIEEYKIKSIAIPPLGCGNGGLKWEKVKAMMDKYLGQLPNIAIQIYEPNEAVKEILQKEEVKKEVGLTAPRAMLLYALFKYEKLGEVATIFSANKLAYFLQKSGEPMRLQFVPYKYGPYAQAIEKVLYALNGKYLSGMEQMQARAFEPLQLNYKKYDEVEMFVNTNLSSDQKQRLESVFTIIDGFETTLSLEILSSAHFLISENPSLTEDQLFEKIQDWNERKKSLVTKEYITIALEHLNNYGNKLNFA
ncbi:MAG: macro domain-containing protein [Saprospiraceae bacterium]|nr:macro domain-containing protein [Saprospiraceae bacterium]HMX88317.1 macro domain-containing protein [Saprospiraceae bacterium]HMZ40399.1 macro domain-containing protein [Saprospiraceae bacterium]HNB30270.1 macro domain-containing protein [Saprospiraceae bacterium]HNC35635.1 macro domain-containing protein [Saprospiraceae bacterium]